MAIQRVNVFGGVSIAYEVTGSGPPLLLIHGAEADHTMFSQLVPILAPDFACIAYDQRDSGESTNPAEPYNVTDMGDDAARLIRALGHEKVAVFGTSLGSVIAQALAVRHPDLVGHLVLSAAIRIGRGIGDINPDVGARLAELRRDPARNGMEIAAYFFTASHLAAHPELAQRFKGGKRTPGQQARRNALIPTAPLLPLGGITAKTLVLAHAEDKLVPPAHSLGIAKEIPAARTVVLDGLGHVGTIQAPERVAQAVRPFLTS